MHFIIFYYPAVNSVFSPCANCILGIFQRSLFPDDTVYGRCHFNLLKLLIISYLNGFNMVTVAYRLFSIVTALKSAFPSSQLMLQSKCVKSKKALQIGLSNLFNKQHFQSPPTQLWLPLLYFALKMAKGDVAHVLSRVSREQGVEAALHNLIRTTTCSHRIRLSFKRKAHAQDIAHSLG